MPLAASRPAGPVARHYTRHALLSRVLDALGDLYGVDVCCDDDVVPYYRRFGFQQVNGMVLRPQLKPRVNPAD